MPTSPPPEAPEDEPTDPIGWVTTEDVERLWTNSTDLDPDDLDVYLLASYEQCKAFLNDRDPDPVSPRHVLAQIMQARALSRSMSVGSGDQIGPDGETVTVYPMDWTVKALLRPKRAKRFVR